MSHCICVQFRSYHKSVIMAICQVFRTKQLIFGNCSSFISFDFFPRIVNFHQEFLCFIFKAIQLSIIKVIFFFRSKVFNKQGFEIKKQLVYSFFPVSMKFSLSVCCMKLEDEVMFTVAGFKAMNRLLIGNSSLFCEFQFFYS